MTLMEPPPGLPVPLAQVAKSKRLQPLSCASNDAARRQLSLHASPFVPRNVVSGRACSSQASPLPSCANWVNAVNTALGHDLTTDDLCKAIRLVDQAIAARIVEAESNNGNGKHAQHEAESSNGNGKHAQHEVSHHQQSLLASRGKMAVSSAPQVLSSDCGNADSADCGGEQALTLSTSLQLLANEDPDTLIIVRRINKLGFKAVRALKRHLSIHGEVVRVLVAHSVARKRGDTECQLRRRPSSLGFVQMKTAEAVGKVLAGGCEQEINGAVICIQRFERQHAGDASCKDSDPDDGEWLRLETSASDLSTEASSSRSSAIGGAPKREEDT